MGPRGGTVATDHCSGGVVLFAVLAVIALVPLLVLLRDVDRDVGPAGRLPSGPGQARLVPAP